MAQNSRHEGYPGEAPSSVGATAVARTTTTASTASGTIVPMAQALTLCGRGAPEPIDIAVVSLVVMEPGSEWPRHFEHHSNVLAFSQKREKLLQRTQEELDILRRGQQSVRVAVLACNGDTDGEVDRYRTKIARTLLTAVTGTTFGRLVLSASGGAPLRARQGLLALAGTLSEQVRGTSATVSLRFTEAALG